MYLRDAVKNIYTSSLYHLGLKRVLMCLNWKGWYTLYTPPSLPQLPCHSLKNKRKQDFLLASQPLPRLLWQCESTRLFFLTVSLAFCSKFCAQLCCLYSCFWLYPSMIFHSINLQDIWRYKNKYNLFYRRTYFLRLKIN